MKKPVVSVVRRTIGRRPTRRVLQCPVGKAIFTSVNNPITGDRTALFHRGPRRHYRRNTTSQTPAACSGASSSGGFQPRDIPPNLSATPAVLNSTCIPLFQERALRRPAIKLFLPAAAAFTLCGCHHATPVAKPAAPVAVPGPVAATTTDPDVLAAIQDHPIIRLAVAPAESGSVPVRRKRLYFVRGGTLTTVRSASRDMVSDLIGKVGGVGGLNGTFFSDARVAGRGNKMIGPLLTAANHEYAPVDPSDAPRCVGRPLVILDGTQIAIVPYALWMGESEDALRRVLPNATDAFLAGGWLVHNGEPRGENDIQANCVSDAMDFRRRAFVGIDKGSRIVLGATDYSIDSAHLAKSLKKLDIQEAVLLDSGFSTSLVWKDTILVSGHSRKSMPSRPVPHALVVLDHAAGGPPS